MSSSMSSGGGGGGGGGGDGGGANVKVVCRIRPQNKLELANQGVECVAVQSDQSTVVVMSEEGKHVFQFDRVFSAATSQAEVYDYGAKEIVNDVMAGYNGTVFAYGQTGSGKTHTMEGSDIMDPVNRGLIPRIITAIFVGVANAVEEVEFTMKVSMIEIYMERIRDLIDPSRDNLPVHEDKQRGIWVGGVSEVYVGAEEEVWDLLRRGQMNRAVAATRMNEGSSRSHSLFICTIQQKNMKDLSVKTGKLYLVDLAGSEKVGKTHAAGTQLEEAKTINKSLSALGNVINALTDGKSTHVPYRDSKLTRVLQESVGGNARTTLIITASSSSYNVQETVSTFRFGTRAKSIRNKPRINKEMSPAELKAMLAKSEKEIERLKERIQILEDELSLFKGGDTSALTSSTSSGGAAGGAVAGAAGAGKGDSAAAQAAVLRIQAKYDDLAHERDLLETNIKDLEEQLRETQEREDDMLDRMKELTSEGEVSRALIGKLEDEVRLLVDSENSLKTVNEHLMQQVAEGQIRLEDIEAELTLKREELKGLVEAHAQLEQQNRELHERLLEKDDSDDVLLPKEAGEWERKQRELRRELENITGDGKTGDAQSAKNAQVVTELQAKVAELEEMVVSLSVDKEQVTCEKEDAEEQLEALRSRMLQLELEKSSLRDQLSAKDSEIEQQARALETLRAAPVVPASSGGLTADEALEQLKAMQSRFDQASEQLDATRRQHAEKIEQSNRDLLGVREELQKVSHTNEQAQREVAKLQKALAEKAAALEKREAEIETWKSEKSKVEENFRMFQANTARTLGEMENLRAALLHDLQNRCEKVVQLEMMLDEERDTARATPNRSSLQQLKGKLKEQEKNLAQITQEYQNLFRRTADLTREVAMYQKQLEGARTRIRDLETINLGLREDVRRIEQSSEQELARVVAQLQSNGASRIRSNSVSQPGVPGAGVSMSTAPTYRGMSKEPHAHISVPKVMRGGGVGAPRPSMSSDGAPDSSVSGMRSPSSGEGSPSASAAASSESTAMPARQMRAPAAAPASSSGVASFFDRLTGFGRSTSAASSAADEQRASRRTASGVLEMSGGGAGAGGGGSGGGGAVQMTSMSLSSNLTAAQFEQAFPTSSVPEKRTPPPPLPPRR